MINQKRDIAEMEPAKMEKMQILALRIVAVELIKNLVSLQDMLIPVLLHHPVESSAEELIGMDSSGMEIIQVAMFQLMLLALVHRSG